MQPNDPHQSPMQFLNTARQFVRLFQSEMTLAKAEMSHNLSRAGLGIALIIVAVIMLITAVNLAASALVAYIQDLGFSIGMAALIGAGIFGLLAVIFALIAKRRLSLGALTPTRTIDNLKRDTAAMKGYTHE